MFSFGSKIFQYFWGSVTNKNINFIDQISNILNVAKAVTESSSIDEAFLKIQNDNNSKDAFLKQMQSQDLSAAYNDSHSARDRDKVITKKFGYNFRANLLLFFTCLLLIGCVIVLIFFRTSLATDVVAIISGITGILSQCLRDAFHFEFGGYKEKNKF